MKYKVTVDRNTCIACGVAPSMCPEVFILGEDNGKVKIVDKYGEKTSEDASVGQVPEELYDCIKSAADACPVQAITIEEIP